MPANRCAAVVISGSGNYFYNAAGRRLATTLRTIGWDVSLGTLRTIPDKNYDWCYLMNTTDLVASVGDEREALRRLLDLRHRSRRVVLWLMEAVTTQWFEKAYRLGRKVGIDFLFDFGLQSQSDDAPRDVKSIYRFIFGGLTEAEKKLAQEIPSVTTHRPIPWTFIGHYTPARAKLVHRLVTTGESNGFVYLSRIGIVNDLGPHLNEEQSMQVLKQSRLYIWNTHHTGFYMEVERFRMALLAGALPLKILLQPRHSERVQLFSYLILAEDQFFQQLPSLDFLTLFQKFRDDFCGLPSFEQRMHEILGLE